MDEIIPVVGMGATIMHWSDRDPATIIEVKSPRRIVIQKDKYTRTDNNGMSSSQTYTYEPDPDGSIYFVTKRKGGEWRISKDNTLISLGNRRRYHDYEF